MFLVELSTDVQCGVSLGLVWLICESFTVNVSVLRMTWIFIFNVASSLNAFGFFFLFFWEQ